MNCPHPPTSPQSLSGQSLSGQDNAVVAVTGALGLIGRRLVHRLEADPRVARIVTLDVRNPIELALREGESTDPADLLAAHPKLSAHQLDLTDPGGDAELATIFENEAVTHVCHLAFLSYPTHAMEQAHELETIGTMYVLNAVKACGLSRLVSLSSTMCYGAHPDNPVWLTEDHALRGTRSSRFIRDKIDADQQVMRFAQANRGISCAVLRTGAVLAGHRFWGRYLRRPVVPTVLGHNPLMQLLHPGDAAEGLACALFSEASGAFNLVGKGVLPLSHVVAHLGGHTLRVPASVCAGVLRSLWRAQLIEMPPKFADFLRWGWLADGHKMETQMGFVAKFSIFETIQHALEHK